MLKIVAFERIWIIQNNLRAMKCILESLSQQMGCVLSHFDVANFLVPN